MVAPKSIVGSYDSILTLMSGYYDGLEDGDFFQQMAAEIAGGIFAGGVTGVTMSASAPVLTIPVAGPAALIVGKTIVYAGTSYVGESAVENFIDELKAAFDGYEGRPSPRLDRVPFLEMGVLHSGGEEYRWSALRGIWISDKGVPLGYSRQSSGNAPDFVGPFPLSSYSPSANWTDYRSSNAREFALEVL